MKTYSRNEWIDAVPEVCFDYLCDQSNISKWLPAVSESKIVPAGPVIKGAEFHQIRQDGRKMRPVVCKVVTHARPSVHTVEINILGLQTRFEYTFEPKNGGCSVTMKGSLQGKGFKKILELMIWPVVEKTDRSAMTLLKGAMEKDGLTARNRKR